jgi:hypothetical protein
VAQHHGFYTQKATARLEYKRYYYKNHFKHSTTLFVRKIANPTSHRNFAPQHSKKMVAPRICNTFAMGNIPQLAYSKVAWHVMRGTRMHTAAIEKEVWLQSRLRLIDRLIDRLIAVKHCSAVVGWIWPYRVRRIRKWASARCLYACFLRPDWPVWPRNSLLQSAPVRRWLAPCKLVRTVECDITVVCIRARRGVVVLINPVSAAVEL